MEGGRVGWDCVFVNIQFLFEDMTDWLTMIQRIGLAKREHTVFMGIIYLGGVPGIPEKCSTGCSSACWCPDLSLHRANKYGRMVCCINWGWNNAPAQVFVSGVCLLMALSWKASLPPHFKRYPLAWLEILSGWECESMVFVLRWPGPDASAASGMDSSMPPWPNRWVLTEPYHQHSDKVTKHLYLHSYSCVFFQYLLDYNTYKSFWFNFGGILREPPDINPRSA